MWYASIDSNLREEDRHPCGHLPLDECPAAGAIAGTSYWHGACFVGRSAVRVWVVCVIHIRPFPILKH